MKSRVFWICALTLCAPLFSMAEHITGGDFTVRHVEGNTFEATLTLYRDCASGGAPFDELVGITVFDAATDEHLVDLDFVFDGFETIVPSLGNSCFVPDVCLEIGVYQTEFELPDNPNGYYLTKERCCRNNLSVNLNGTNLGFVFTVDVPDPALQNSTPEFGEYPSEAYLCVNGPNVIDFGANDADGDELVYSFTEPFNGESTFFDPDPFVASAKPYSTIPWAAGFSTVNQVGGTPAMTIDPATGVITAQPIQIGVFTVAVQVQEFRNGVLIGTVRRELQLTATGCQFDFPSVINTPNGDTVFDVLANTEFCIPIEVTDPNTGDTLFVEGSGELLDGTVFPQASYPDANGFSTIVQDFCWSPICENLQDEPYVVTITAFSLGCANEVLVTTQDLYFNVFIEDDETTLLEEPMEGETVIVDLYDPVSYCFDYVFVDPNEADTLIVTPSSAIFDLPNVDQLDVEVDQGTVTLPFCWNAVCEDVSDDPYFVDFEVVATNCEVQDTVNFTVPIEVVVPPDDPASFVTPMDTVRWEFYSTDTFCMPVTFVDPNFFDTLQVTAVSELFTLPGNSATFQQPLNGLNILEGDICWVPRCEDVREEPYIINFTGTSFSCKTDETVNYTVVLYLDLPPETAPAFDFPMDGFAIEHSIGDDPIDFSVIATDPDPYDTLVLSAESVLFDSELNAPLFEGFTNTETVFSEFSWTPDCPDVSDEPYTVSFIVTSSSCQKEVVRTLDVPFSITTPTRGIIEPIQNIFTPNGDGRNDVWTIENKDDPCLLNFKASVFDRWGVEVFNTADPAFIWKGEYDGGSEATSGQYFYTIEYFYRDAVQSYDGTVSLSR